MNQILQTVGKLLGVDLYLRLTPKRLHAYEHANKVQLGLVADPHYVWSHQFRKEASDDRRNLGEH